MPRIIDKVINPIVGLGAEAYAHHKNKSRSPSPNPQTSRGREQHGVSSSSSGQDVSPDYESDEEAWELDDASEDVERAQQGAGSGVPKGNWASPASVDAIANSFLSRHRPGNYSLGSNLSVPVILPQKRPHTKMRGFVRAYAPVLEDCGIDQTTWMEFLDHFHESTKVGVPASSATILL